jgi:pectinesterase
MKRVSWSHQLTDDEAKKYTPKNILGGDDNWDFQGSLNPPPMGEFEF